MWLKSWLLVVCACACYFSPGTTNPVAEETALVFKQIKGIARNKEWYVYLVDQLFNNYSITYRRKFFNCRSVVNGTVEWTKFSCVRVVFTDVDEHSFRFEYYCANDTQPYNRILVYRRASGIFYKYENVERDLCDRRLQGELKAIETDGRSYIHFISHEIYRKALFVPQEFMQTFYDQNIGLFENIVYPEIYEVHLKRVCKCFPRPNPIASSFGCDKKKPVLSQGDLFQRIILLSVPPVLLLIAIIFYR